MEKECTRCKIIRPLNQFSKNSRYKLGVKSECKVCDKERSLNYYYTNKESAKLKAREYKKTEKYKLTREKYLENNREKINKVKNIYRLNNRNRILQKRKEYYQHKKNDPIFALSKRLRQRIYHVLRDYKSKKTLEILGCSWEEFKTHIESQFTEGMSWNSLDKIHIDHIIPISSAKTVEEVYKLNHYSNLQPLWAKDNLEKYNKIMNL